MEFTTVEEVKSLFRRIKIKDAQPDPANNTVITTEEVEAFIEETEIAIKSAISRCYVVESIGTQSKKLLGMVVKYIVADTIQTILKTTSSQQDKDKQLVENNWSKKAKEMLSNICPDDFCSCSKKPVIPLPDTPLNDTAQPVDDNTFSYSVSKAEFKKGKDNW